MRSKRTGNSKMKKISLFFLLLLVFLPAFALVETQTGSKEVPTEAAHKAKYQSPDDSFSLWYPADSIAVYDSTTDASQVKGKLLLLPADAESSFPTYMEIYSPGITGMTADAFIGEMPQSFGLSHLSGVESAAAESGAAILTRNGAGNDLCYRFYVIEDGSRQLQAIAQFTADTEERFSAEFFAIIRSIVFEK